MAVKLDNVVPFGRSFDEYVNMFALTEKELQRSILSVADGPASFNAEGTRLGYRITSVDPLYCFEASDIKQRFDAVVDNIISQIESTPDDWVGAITGLPATYVKTESVLSNNFARTLSRAKQTVVMNWDNYLS